MAAPIALRGDFDGPGLRRLAKQSKDATRARRLLALAEIYDGGSRADAARIGGVTLQIVRNAPRPSTRSAVNALRGHLAEFGVIAAKGPVHTSKLIAAIEDPANGRTSINKGLLSMGGRKARYCPHRTDRLSQRIKHVRGLCVQLARSAQASVSTHGS